MVKITVSTSQECFFAFWRITLKSTWHLHSNQKILPSSCKKEVFLQLISLTEHPNITGPPGEFIRKLQITPLKKEIHVPNLYCLDSMLIFPGCILSPREKNGMMFQTLQLPPQKITKWWTEKLFCCCWFFSNPCVVILTISWNSSTYRGETTPVTRLQGHL